MSKAIPIAVAILVLTSAGASANKQVLVPENVAALLRPILDIQQQSIQHCGALGEPSPCISGKAYLEQHRRSTELNRRLQSLIGIHTLAADEALVVLNCFYIGESQEEADAVLQRGGRMLPIISKYEKAIPKIPNRNYPTSMLKPDRASTLEDLAHWIRQGLKSTADHP